MAAAEARGLVQPIASKSYPPAPGSGSGSGGNSPSGSLSDDDIRRRIREGNNQRLQEQQKAAAEKSARQKEEADEIVTSMQYIVNFIVALVFVSMPLSEPEIDWLEVGVFVVANLLWNLFLHHNTYVHMSLLLMINLCLTQYASHARALPEMVMRLDPVRSAIAIGSNAVVLLAAAIFFVRKVPAGTPERERRVDYTILGMFALNIGVLVATGHITRDMIILFLRASVNLVTNFTLKAQ